MDSQGASPSFFRYVGLLLGRGVGLVDGSAQGVEIAPTEAGLAGKCVAGWPLTALFAFWSLAAWRTFGPIATLEPLAALRTLTAFESFAAVCAFTAVRTFESFTPLRTLTSFEPFTAFCAFCALNSPFYDSLLDPPLTQ